MIEVIYKEDKEDQGTVQEPFSMPRNVRQIGLANGDYRIYIEDYVYTFLCSLAEDGETESQGNVAVLTGEIQWTTDMTCIYVKGALAADGMEATAEHIDFSEKIWQKIQDDKEQYFQEQEIVGWFFAQPQIAIEVTELLVKVHLRHFGGEKILMLMDPGEREDAFFRYDGGTMAKLTGYYIYYERNEDMQNYMVENRKGHGSEELLEAANLKKTTNIRRRSEKVKPVENKHRGRTVAATMAAAAAVVVLGVTLVNRFYMPNRAKTVNGSVTDETVNVQVVEGAVTANNSAGMTGESTSETFAGGSEQNPVNEVVTEDDTGENGTTSESAKTTNVTTSKRYTVRKGDTLANISLSLYNDRDYVDTICEINDIEDPDVIYEGMVLELP